MNKKQFLEVHGDCVLKFVDYYKYRFRFVFEGPSDLHISAHMGGDREEIYRADITSEMTVKELDCEVMGTFYVNGNEIENDDK